MRDDISLEIEYDGCMVERHSIQCTTMPRNDKTLPVGSTLEQRVEIVRTAQMRLYNGIIVVQSDPGYVRSSHRPKYPVALRQSKWKGELTRKDFTFFGAWDHLRLCGFGGF